MKTFGKMLRIELRAWWVCMWLERNQVPLRSTEKAVFLERCLHAFEDTKRTEVNRRLTEAYGDRPHPVF